MSIKPASSEEPALNKSNATKERILSAATEEFAEFGVAGARVDRIARTARANKSLIYAYFGSKEQLLEAVLDRHLKDVMVQVPFTPTDLPSYGVALLDFVISQPQQQRLLSWYGLARIQEKPATWTVNFANKVKAIKREQARGAITDRMSAEFILGAIISFASSYSEVNALQTAISPPAKRKLPTVRLALAEAVSRLIHP